MDLGRPQLFRIRRAGWRRPDGFALGRFQVRETFCFPDIDTIAQRIGIIIVPIFMDAPRIGDGRQQWIGKGLAGGGHRLHVPAMSIIKKIVSS